VQDSLFDFSDDPSPERPDARSAAAPAIAKNAGKKAGQKVAPAAVDDALAALAATLPPNLYFGTSSWYFPGWNGLVFGHEYPESTLSRHGLAAYGQHPLLRSVGLDRSFYAPLAAADYARYAAQVPADFRFLVKAPGLVTDAQVRDEKGQGVQPNAAFLDATLATDQFVLPCLEGLGEKAGVLLFQFSPLPRALLADLPALVERLRAFFAGLPRGPLYAAEFRDEAVVTPRLVQMLREAGVRYGIGLHARMPDIARQQRALEANGPGPLVVRWVLRKGLSYSAAKARYAPFGQLVDEEPHTRQAMAELIAATLRSGQPVFVIVNNKAEGSAPLSVLRLADSVRTALSA
jgi:uncharacterized protein YecE (DUF72 family)